LVDGGVPSKDNNLKHGQLVEPSEEGGTKLKVQFGKVGGDESENSKSLRKTLMGDGEKWIE